MKRGRTFWRTRQLLKQESTNIFQIIFGLRWNLTDKCWRRMKSWSLVWIRRSIPRYWSSWNSWRRTVPRMFWIISSATNVMFSCDLTSKYVKLDSSFDCQSFDFLSQTKWLSLSQYCPTIVCPALSSLGFAHVWQIAHHLLKLTNHHRFARQYARLCAPGLCPRPTSFCSFQSNHSSPV